MKLLVLSLCVLLASNIAGPVEARGTSGTWTAYAKDSGRLQLSMQVEPKGNIGMGFELSQFAGLSWNEVRSVARVPVRFEMRREAGTVSFEGTFHDGRGAGKFTFVANADYRGMLERLGVHLDTKRGEEDCELLNVALFDVSTDFVRSMQAIGYKVTLQEYVTFRIFKVDPAYVREMAGAGFAHLSADKLVETRIHNVTPEYIRDMRAHGEDLSLDDYVQSRIFEITPEFTAEMGRLGYRDLDHDTLVQFRIQGVSADFIEDLRKLGYSRIPADQLVAMRIHGVTPEFIRRVEKAGYHDVPIERLVEMRIFNIDPEMVGARDQGRR